MSALTHGPRRMGTEAPQSHEANVHVWRASLSLSASNVQGLLGILSADETERARHYRFARDRARFIAARGFLRTVLARYIRIRPENVRFCYTAYGKPVLASGLATDIHFNLSHSCDLAVCAVAHGRRVGIDVERIRPVPDADQIADRFFTEQESASLRALSYRDRLEAFLRLWTVKEAYGKALGRGLSLALDQCSVCVVPGQPATLVHASHSPDVAQRWGIGELVPAPGYLASIVVEGRDWRLSCWEREVCTDPTRGLQHILRRSQDERITRASTGITPSRWRTTACSY
jgi:4'-phosphopantetheinyl transferase